VRGPTRWPIDPHTSSTLYAATGGGVYQSTNSGGSWSLVNTGLTATNASALAVDPLTPTTVDAGTHGGVFETGTPQPPPLHHVLVGTGTADSCTEALDAALAGGGLVTFDCGPVPVTITLTLTQQKAISSDTIVDGGGFITLDGTHAVRVFTVAQGVALNVENLTIVNGSGSAIYINSALTVINSTFSGNSAYAAAFRGVPGGAIGNAGGGATLTVSNSTFTGNAGGAIGNGSDSTMTVSNTIIAKNTSTDLACGAQYGMVRFTRGPGVGKRKTKVPEALFDEIELKIAI
jgi:hypothetical protein